MQYGLAGKTGASNVVFHPLTILSINVVLPLFNTLLPSEETFIFNIACALVIVLLCKLYIKFLKVILFLSIYFGIYLLLLNYHILLPLVTLMKMTNLFIPCFIIVPVLVTCYNSSQLISALEIIRLPKIFVIALSVTIRYIPTFGKEFEIIKEAMAVRGIKTTGMHPLKTLEYILVPQLFRCLSLSNQLTIAAITKGIEEPRRRSSYFQSKLGWADLTALGVLFIAYGIFIVRIHL